MSSKQDIMDSMSPFPSTPINSVKDVKSKAEEAMETARKIIENGKMVPLTFFVHTQDDESMRFLPTNIPRNLIAPVLTSIASSNSGASAIVNIAEAWALWDEGGLKVGSSQAIEWVVAGNAIKDHPDAIEVVIVTASCHVGGYGQFNYCGTAMIKDANGARRLDPASWDVTENMEGSLSIPVADVLTTIEDPDFLREKMNEPKRDTYSHAANDWDQ